MTLLESLGWFNEAPVVDWDSEANASFEPESLPPSPRDEVDRFPFIETSLKKNKNVT